MRLIDGDALKNRKFTTNECNGFGEGHAYRQGWNDAIDAIMDNEITVEPERKKGKWMRLNDIDGFVRCSSCGTFWDRSIIETLHFHFCPSCGSYNGGDSDEQ